MLDNAGLNVIDKIKGTELSRRKFLQVSAISGVGFSIGLSVSGTVSADGHQDKMAFGHFIKIANDNSITVVIKHLDKGQGVTTGLTAIVAEEINADWSQMKWEFAPSDPTRYNNLLWGPYQGTGGSTAIANSWMQLRQAGAAAKQMLISAAAKQWGVAESSVRAEGGVLKAKDKSATYGEMAEAAALIAPPEEPKLKDPKDFTLIGHSIPRIDSKEKSTGKARYTIDVKLPNMLVAAIAHPPKFGATLKGLTARLPKPLMALNLWLQCLAVSLFWQKIIGQPGKVKMRWSQSGTIAKRKLVVQKNCGRNTKLWHNKKVLLRAMMETFPVHWIRLNTRWHWSLNSPIWPMLRWNP